MQEPSDQLIQEWKEKYGKIFSVTNAGTDYYFRPLTYKEFAASERFKSLADADDFIFERAVVYPEDINSISMSAGFFTSLIEEIMEASGFSSVHSARASLDTFRQKVEEDPWNVMKSFVMIAMPAYKEEELDKLTFDQLAYKVALAENIIRINQTIFGIEGEIKVEFTDPEEEIEQQRAQAAKHDMTKRGSGQATYDDPIAAKLRNAMGG